MLQPLHFTCPQCAARLRVRDPMYVGRQISCPECAASLILDSRPDGPVARLFHDAGVPQEHPSVGPASLGAPAGLPQPATEISPPAPARFASWHAWRRVHPVWMWVVVSSACGAALLVPFWAPWRDDRPVASPPAPAELAPATPVVPADRAAVPAGAQVPLPPRADSPDVPAGRLQELSRRLQAYYDENGSYPPGGKGNLAWAPDQRLGWMAILSAMQEPRLSVHWDRTWHDPLNEAFVRRRLLIYQNPAVPLLTGADGYPASHFVGVAGVGSDAARLPLEDPRAGIFGDERRTRREDILDGASETMLMAGVHEQLGAWASAGRATVRGFAKPPFVNGPDGFGTGQAGKMFVLLVDGSVRTITTETDPEVVRQLAAMSNASRQRVEPLAVAPKSADGGGEESPLTEMIIRRDRERLALGPVGLPGHPVRPDPGPSDEPDVAKPDRGAPEGRDAPAADPSPVPPPQVERTQAELARILQQPILEYRLEGNTSVSAALQELADMAGARLVFAPGSDPALERRLESRIQLRLARTTLGAVLDHLLDAARLRYQLKPGSIELAPMLTEP